MTNNVKEGAQTDPDASTGLPTLAPGLVLPVTARVIINDRQKGVEIHFSRAPAAEVREALQAFGFEFQSRMYTMKPHWWIKGITQEHIKFANKIAKGGARE